MELECPYKNGHWYWGSDMDQIEFVSHELVMKIEQDVPKSQKRQKQILPTTIRFREQVEPLEKLHFRRTFQRRIPFGEAEFITLQDVKDVAIFLASSKDLSVEFIRYLHLPEVDRFLKALIIYFHYYVQVIDAMHARKEEAKRKLRQPIVDELERITRDNLSDLRAMVAREYSVIIMGIGKAKKFHHLNTSTSSLSERDRRLGEALLCMSVRVVWIALQRRHLQNIEAELNRLTRTDMFTGLKGKKKVVRTEYEMKVLLGSATGKETKLKQRSSLIKELLHVEHDYRLLGAGFKDFEPKNKRTEYMEKIYAAPYESLLENNITIGLMGIPREHYDSIMKPRERTSKNFDKIINEPINFNFPPDLPVPFDQIPDQFPSKPCQYQETIAMKKARSKQCAMWSSHLVGVDRPLLPTTSVISMAVDDGDN